MSTLQYSNSSQIFPSVAFTRETKSQVQNSCAPGGQKNSKSLFIHRVRAIIHEDDEKCQRSQKHGFTRRELAQSMTLGGLLLAYQDFSASPASAAFLPPPPKGYRTHMDRLDGYYFYYPQDWVEVKGAGADSFYRDPSKLDENLSLNISSPSSSRFQAVSDLGTPEEAGQKVLNQYLKEFMSTRLGVQRESKLVSATARTAGDGKEYYDIQVNVKSYANNNELAIMPNERVVRLEWDRRYIVVLGVENKRLYQLRLQLPESAVESDSEELRTTMESFRVVTV